jgi:hypothetical protein
MASLRKLSTVSVLASGSALQGLIPTHHSAPCQHVPVKKNINNDMSMEDLKDTIDDLLVLTRRLKGRFEHKNVQYRLPNFPEHISENMVMRIIQQTDTSCTRSCSGDLYSSLQGKIEVKCFTSVGPSTFGPKCNWDVIYFLDAMEWTNNHFVLYKINLKNSSEEWKKIKMTKGESYADKCHAKVRPHLKWSLLYPQISEHAEIVFDGSFEDITPTNSSGSEATFRVSSEGGFQPPLPIMEEVSEQST